MALVYILLAILTGCAVLEARIARSSHVERFVAGSVVLTLSFAILSALHRAGWMPFVALAFASFGVARSRLQPFNEPVRPARALMALGIMVLVLRAVWFADRLPLTAAHPSGFAWIDTPLWLSLAHGADAGMPPPDLLYSGGTVNYHFGAFVIVAMVHRLTGLPMHVAYILTAFTHASASCFLLGRCLHRWFGLRSITAEAIAALVGVAWLEFLTRNASSLVGVCLGLWMLLELSSIRNRAGLARSIVASFALALVKEVQWFHVMVAASTFAVIAILRHRHWKPMIALAVAAPPALFVQRLLMRPDEQVETVLNRPHIEAEHSSPTSFARM